MSSWQCGVCDRWENQCECVTLDGPKFDAACEEFRALRRLLAADISTPALDLLFLDEKTEAPPAPTAVAVETGTDAAG